MLVGCGKKEPVKKLRREDIMKQATMGRQALLDFALGLKGVLDWKQAQPARANPDQAKKILSELAAKITKIPAKDLPADLADSWGAVVAAIQDAAAAASPSPSQSARLQQATASLNAALQAQGIVDLHL